MRDHAANLLRFQRIEIDATRLFLSGLALTLPAAVGAATGHLSAGLIAAMGALLISSAGHEGGWRARALDISVTGAAGMLAVWSGAVAQHQGGICSVCCRRGAWSRRSA